jgi:hypothetical protein
MKKIYFFFLILLSFSNTFSQTVILGTDTTGSPYIPFARTYAYSVYEVIYLASQIGFAGTVNSVGFDRVDGTDITPIDSVKIYFKNTSNSTFSTGFYSTAGYTLVYDGAFPNDGGAGWRQVLVSNGFPYDGTSNLQMMVVKRYQTPIADSPVAPRWIYSSLPNNSAREYYGNTPILPNTTLNPTNYCSNTKLDISSVGITEIAKCSVSLFPNPANDRIQIEHPLKDGNLSIMNETGEIVYTAVFNEKAEVDLNKYSRGVYYLILNDQSGKRITTETFVKN